MQDNVSMLHTEQRNPDTVGIADLSTLDMMKKINNEDKKVAYAVEQALPAVAAAVDLIAARLAQGGRMLYVGAGTSGRLGYMDAAECGPTYGMPYETVSCVMAGGRDAVFQAQESVEDRPDCAVADLQARNLTAKDVVVAAAASGRTPYCIGALDYARSIGAGAVSLACNPNAVLSAHADVAIEVDCGPEAVMGSTRMKAGSAQKMIMNMLSTGAMIKIGRTQDNLMVCMHARNEKIAIRSVRLFKEATGCEDEQTARQYLQDAGNEMCYAVLMYKTGCTREQAAEAMKNKISFHTALEKLRNR